MKKIYWLLILTTGFLAENVKAQQSVIDSLRKELSGTLPDTTRSMSMMRLAVALETVDTAASIRMSDEAIRFTLDRKLFFQAGRIYFNKSFVLSKANRFSEARNCLDSALLLLEKSNRPDVPFRKAQVYAELGNHFRHLDDYKKALEYLNKASVIYQEDNRPASLITNYLNISSIYKMMNEYGKEEEYARMALATARQTNKPSDLFDAHYHLALALIMQGNYQPALTHIDSARNYQSSAISYERVVSFELISGLEYLNLNMLDSAYHCFKRSRDLAASVQDVFSTIQSEMQLAHVLVRQKKISEAEQILLEQYKKIRQQPENSQLVIALEYLSDLYEAKGDFSKALDYYKQFKQVSDSISQDANKKYAANLEITYKTRLKDAEILRQQETIKQKSNLNNVLMLGSFLLLTTLVLLYRNYRQKKALQEKKIQELEAEKKLMATEAILIGEEQERTRLARDLHDGLGGMLSGIKFSLNTIRGNIVMPAETAASFEKSITLLNDSIQEMRRVAHNMMPEALVKFGLDTALRDFCSDFNSAGTLNVSYQSAGLDNKALPPTTSITVYRIIQELLNNTIKHAKARNALVQLYLEENQLSITVEDDGIGMDTRNLEEKKGIGWANIRNRVEFLQGNLDLRSKPGEGCSVFITLHIP